MFSMKKLNCFDFISFYSGDWCGYHVFCTFISAGMKEIMRLFFHKDDSERLAWNYKAKNISYAALSSILGDNSRTSPQHPPRTQRKVEVLERWP